MNPILEKSKAALLAKVDKRLLPVILKTVEAGKKVMYSDQTRNMAVEQLKQGSDPESIGAAVTKLAGVLFTESKRTMPMQVLVPAANLLLMEALQFLEDAGAVKADAEFVAACTQELGSALLQMMGATPEQIQGYMSKAQGAPQPAPQPPSGIVAGARAA